MDRFPYPSDRDLDLDLPMPAPKRSAKPSATMSPEEVRVRELMLRRKYRAAALTWEKPARGNRCK
jgi:hypothetical protein